MAVRLSGPMSADWKQVLEEKVAKLDEQLEDLVIANRILAREGVVDGFGHVSLRHPDRPDRFFMSRSRSPELIALDDIMEFDLDCNPIDRKRSSRPTSLTA
jgi:HCOMODA/2-hydroxy-3-carboxy-muconic semialdehyde decarboxylase